MRRLLAPFSSILLLPLLLAGCRGSHHVEENVGFEPAQLSYGMVVKGGHFTKRVLLRNRGQETVRLEATEVPAAFFVDPKAATLAPGGVLSMEVTFAPEELGCLAGTVRFRSNTGTEATLHVEGTGIPTAADVPDEIDFGDVFIGDSKTLEVSVESLTDAPLAVAVSLDPSSPFSVEESEFPLPPRGTSTLHLTYAPRVRNPSVDMMTLNLCTSCPDIQVPVRGNALADELQATPNPLSFGKVAPGLVGVATFQVTNTGDRPTSLIPPSIVGGDGTFLIAKTDVPSPLPPGESGEITVTFTPTALPPVEGTVHLENEVGTNELDVRLVGEGGGPLLQATPASVDFGTQPAGRLRKAVVRLENVLEPYSARVQSVDIEGPAADAYQVEAPALPVDLRDGPLEVEVSFRGDRMGTRPATLVFHTSLPLQPVVRVDMTAESVAPHECELVPGPAEVRFGLVDNSAPETRTIYLQNQRDADCLVWGFEIAGDDASFFDSAPPPPDVTVVPAGGNLQITVGLHAEDAPVDLLHANLVFHAGSVAAPPVEVPMSAYPMPDMYLQAVESPVVFEPTPRNRATVVSVQYGITQPGDFRRDRVVIATDSSPSFHFYSDRVYLHAPGRLIGLDEVERIVFEPTTEGLYFGQLEVWLQGIPEPFRIDLQGEATGPCQGCDWPSPTCTVRVVNDMTFFSGSGDPLNECHWSVLDGPADAEVSPLPDRTCEAQFWYHLAGWYTVGLLEVRPDDHAIRCKKTVHTL